MEEKRRERAILLGQAARYKASQNKWENVQSLFWLIGVGALVLFALAGCTMVYTIWNGIWFSEEADGVIKGCILALCGIGVLCLILSTVFRVQAQQAGDRASRAQRQIEQIESDIMDTVYAKQAARDQQLAAAMPPDCDTLRFDNRAPFENYSVWREADTLYLLPHPVLDSSVTYAKYFWNPDQYALHLTALPVKQLRYFEASSEEASLLTLLAPDGVWFCTSKEGWLILTDLLPKNVLAFDEVLGQLKRLQQLLDTQQLSPQDFSRAKQALLAYARQVSPTFEPPEALSTCPYCGAPVQEDSREKCVYCGRLR